MVNKGSFFQRLKERWGSGSGVRVDTRNGGARPGSPASVQRVESDGRDLTTGAPIEAKSTRKLTEREEALIALGSHFSELSTMLRGSHARMDDQMTRLITAATTLTTLPALSQQQLDLLRGLSLHMERQNTIGEQVAATMTKLPALLHNVESALQRAAATDERTATTVREFQTTMDRIHASMGKMVEHSETQAKATQQLAEHRDDNLRAVASDLERSQQQAVRELQRASDEGLQSLRRGQEDQSNRLQRLLMENAGWNRAVLIGVGLVVLSIGTVAVLQLLK
jgi:hypothetical protein